MQKIEITPAQENDAPEIHKVMEAVTRSIQNKDSFVADNLDFIRKHISEKGFILKATCSHAIAGFLIVRFPQYEKDNLGFDIGLPNDELCKVAHMESAAVLNEYTGNGIQKKLLAEAERILTTKEYVYLMSTVFPENLYSLNNLLSLGYKIALTKKKYRGIDRNIMLKNLRPKIAGIPDAEEQIQKI